MSSIHERVRSQSWEDWKDDWCWMMLYFIFGSWYAMINMTGPRLHLKKQGIVNSGPEVELPTFNESIKWSLGAEEYQNTQSDDNLSTASEAVKAKSD